MDYDNAFDYDADMEFDAGAAGGAGSVAVISDILQRFRNG